MRSKEVKEAINILFHLQHINTYLDLNKDDFQIKSETIIEWSKSTETVLAYIETLEQLPNKIRDKIKELEKEIEEKHEYGLDLTIIHEHEIDTNGIIAVLKELLEE